jgi:molybdate-binding protein/DNA-binding transcriptional regulator YhcF (GntR family)
MINIYLGGTAQVPIYQQIVEQVKRLIATGSLKHGEHLPTVRQLARQLNINPGTVSRAYSELERQGVIISRRGGGTIVSTTTDDPRLLTLRQQQLSNLVSNSILDALSLGYTTEELATVLPAHLSRWRQERAGIEQSPTGKIKGSPNSITIVGSDDLALDLLISQLKHKQPRIRVQVSHAGSLGGLIALQQARADLAGIHLLDEETGSYNYPYVKHILPGIEVAVVHLAYRLQGFILPRGNPKQLKGLEDLTRPDITMVNRQPGSGTRVLLDLKLRQLGIPTDRINGYRHELETHLAVAATIADGGADVGLGIEAAARSFGLDFIPLFKERYDLVIPAEKYKSKPVSALVRIVSSEGFKRAVTRIGGYDTSETGSVNFIS